MKAVKFEFGYGMRSTGPTLIFEDTFTTLDTAKWQHRTGWMAPTVMAWNDYASNATTVVDSALAPELYSISGGVLSLSARRSVAGDATAINSALSWSGQTMRDWLGPMMISSETFTYGHFQFRARVPSPTKGMFPGIWFYGAQDGSAPPEKQQVEIDLWELFGYPSGKPIATTIHYRNSSNEPERPSLTVGHWDVDTTDWHVYALDWQPTYLRFWYDDILLAEVTGDDATWLNVPMRILMQAMVGAPWFPPGNAPDETTASPNGMQVDYVRVHTIKSAFDEAPSEAPVIACEGADGKVVLSMAQGDFVERCRIL
jgi:beta-glucanase (GH16 family)